MLCATQSKINEQLCYCYLLVMLDTLFRCLRKCVPLYLRVIFVLLKSSITFPVKYRIRFLLLSIFNAVYIKKNQCSKVCDLICFNIKHNRSILKWFLYKWHFTHCLFLQTLTWILTNLCKQLRSQTSFYIYIICNVYIWSYFKADVPRVCWCGVFK